MNEYDVQDAVATAARNDLPVMLAAATILDRLVQWTNANSDGWPYWGKPSKASARLQGLLHAQGRWPDADLNPVEVRYMLRPIKAFLTRQGVSASDVFGDLLDQV